MKQIDIKDREIINSFLNRYQITTSELSFTNLYAYRNKYNFHYIILENFLWIINIENNIYYLSQPIGEYTDKERLRTSIVSMFEFLKGKPFVVKKSDHKFLDLLNSLDFTYTYKSIRSDFDYIYDFDKMKHLKGNKYHKKKNHVNQFLRHYSEWHYEEINIKNYRDVKAICNDWFKDKPAKELIEKDVIYDVLLNYETLGVSGGILYIQNKPVAFTIGENFYNETLLIHFEKAIKDYIGLYPMIFHQYVNSRAGYKYVNREQDLGLEGLRKSKLSYHPLVLIKKFNVRLGKYEKNYDFR